MRPHYRPRRSLLYVPSCVPRFLDKARRVPVDSVIFDLEDSVLPERKAEARANLLSALSADQYGCRERVVRVNHLASAWGRDDLAAVASADIDAVLLPRIESQQDVATALAALDAAGGEHLSIMVQIETPAGVLRAEEICAASPRIACVVLGTSDLTNELHARITLERVPMLHSLSHCLLAARAHDIAIVDGIHLDLKDMKSFEYACRLARDLGLDGKTLIHPDQIAYANDAFTPRPDNVARARRIIDALAEANRAGSGVAVFEGRLVENLHVESAKRTLMIHDMIQQCWGGQGA
ncbi:MAG: HpcH/HpaI aldolase/citrate lyase family protein [Pseudomonadota bacterium]